MLEASLIRNLTLRDEVLNVCSQAKLFLAKEKVLMTTLEKVRRLEQYVSADSTASDPVIDMVMNKLLTREKERMLELQSRLANELGSFEKKYALKSDAFYQRYERGEMGDAMDFVEWSATWEMFRNTKKRLTLLEADPIS